MITQQLQIQKLCQELDEYRANGTAITLQQHLAQSYPDYGSEYPHQQLAKYYADSNFDYENMTTSMAMDSIQRDPKNGFLISETIYAMLQKQLTRDTSYQSLLAGTTRDNSAVVTMPYMDLKFKRTRKKGAELADGETAQRQKIAIGAKFSTPKTYGDIIEFNSDDIKDVKISMLGQFFAGFTGKVNEEKKAMLFNIIINGDDALDYKTKEKVPGAAQTIGISTTNNLAYKDLRRVFIRMAKLGHPVTHLVTSEENLNNTILELPEFANPVQGKPQHTLKIEGASSVPKDFYTYPELGKRILALSKPTCTHEFVRQGLTIDREYIITKRQFVIAFHETLHFMNLWPQAKCLIDPTLTFSTNGFANYMTSTKLED